MNNSRAASSFWLLATHFSSRGGFSTLGFFFGGLSVRRAWRRNWIIFASAADFVKYAKGLPIELQLVP